MEALTGNFTDHHGYLLKVFLDTVDYLSARIADLDQQIDEAIASLPGPDPGRGPGEDGESPGPDLIERLDAIPGIGPRIAQVILAELGPDMSAFPTPGHLASWARLCPRTVQSGTKQGRGRTGKGNPWLKAVLGEAAMSASRTDTFLGARYRRLAKHNGRNKALVAVAREASPGATLLVFSR
ncbi:transposase [Streptomyces mirabilis]